MTGCVASFRSLVNRLTCWLTVHWVNNCWRLSTFLSNTVTRLDKTKLKTTTTTYQIMQIHLLYTEWWWCPHNFHQNRILFSWCPSVLIRSIQMLSSKIVMKSIAHTHTRIYRSSNRIKWTISLERDFLISYVLHTQLSSKSHPFLLMSEPSH